MTRLRLRGIGVSLFLATGAAALAQTTPLASVSGRVVDPSGAPVAGVVLTVESASLQGVRVLSTDGEGRFFAPLLPAGDYRFELVREGFRSVTIERRLRATESATLDLRLELAEVRDALTVTAEPSSAIGHSGGIGSTYPSRLIDRLPLDRSPRGATLLTPGATAASLGGYVTIAGAMSYENVYLVDGVEVKDIVFGQPRPFAIEDAIEEVDTAVSGISAEYGRFTGGVVNVVTRSGGNELRGSFRTTLENERWSALTPYEREKLAADPRRDEVIPTYEGTLGGAVVHDRLWYFLAARRQEISRPETLAYTDLPYRYSSVETREEGKLTWSPSPAASLRVAYSELERREENFLVTPAMDASSLSPRTTPEDLLSVHASAMNRSGLLLEAQLSRRRGGPLGVGARTTDLLSGTILRDGSRGGAQWNSPSFCAVCGVAPGELRRAEEGSRGYVLKGSAFRSTERSGSHHLVAGAEVHDELRKSNSFQSGSGFVITATSARIVNGTVHPIFLSGGSTFIDWRPLVELSKGGRFRTTSAFVNDTWRLGNRWSFNLGLRWDGDDSSDQSGSRISAGEVWSPRLAASFDPGGDGRWTIDAGYARYATSLSFSIGDLGTGAGRPARYTYTYNGPAVNVGDELVPTGEALAGLFDWFFANGGTAMPLRQAPVIPGLNRRIDDGLVLPRCDELSLGATRRLGDRGSARLGLLHRTYTEQYAEQVDLSTGQVVDPVSGRAFDLRIVENGGKVERSYDALLAQLDWRPRPGLRIAASYALSRAEGNFDGDNATPELGGATAESETEAFPEYGELGWRAPSGPLLSDQTHTLRLWALFDAPIPERWGALSVAALERIDSGRAWNAVGQIDSRSYVTNPGYAGPPARVPYFFERRGSRRTDTLFATDLSIDYTFPWRGARTVEPFARLVVVNLFDQSAQIRPGNTTVLTSASDPGLQPFDPFTEQPMRGANWDLAPGFGEALGARDFATPRTWSLALGVRF